MTPLIIIEGVDNIGKDTLIKNFLNEYNNLIIRHFETPKGKSISQQIEYQKEDFLYEFRKQTLRKTVFNNINKKEAYIWNRSHLGEWVYGQIYRKYKPDWIFDLEKNFSFESDDDVFLILLDADAKFTIDNDDNLSFTTDIKVRQREIKLFKEAFKKTHIKNKLLLKVHNNNLQFKNKNDIYEKVLKFVTRTEWHKQTSMGLI